MPLTTIRTAPEASSFTPLIEHQSQTPANFFGGKPVLHYEGLSHRAIAPRSQTSQLPIFARSTDRQGQSREATDAGQDDQNIVAVVDAFISSEYVFPSPGPWLTGRHPFDKYCHSGISPCSTQPPRLVFRSRIPPFRSMRFSA